MKLQAHSSHDLSVALSMSNKCIVSKNTMAILDYVLLTRNDKGVFFFTSATTDSQLTIPAPITLVEGNFERKIALPVKTISQFLSTLPDCTVTFNFVDDKSFSLEYCTVMGDKVKSGKASLTYFMGDDFPQIPKPVVEEIHVSFPGDFFRDVIDKARNFTDNNELRPTMSALCIDVVEDLSEAVFVATNGHVLFRQILSNNPAKGGIDFFRAGNSAQILLHMQYFRAISVFHDVEKVDILTDGRIIRITAGDIEFMCKAIEGKYPNYNSVIPRDNPFYLCFDKKEMLSVIKRVSMFSSASTKLIELKKEGLFIKVSASDIDFCRAADDEVVITDSSCPDNFRIGFKASDLSNIISNIDDDSVRITLADPSRAGVVTANEPAPKQLTLIMSMLLSD